MFTPKEIENALITLFDLFDPEMIEMLYENYGEEIEDISPKCLAKEFADKADTVYEYHAVSSAGDGIDYHGKKLFHQRAVNLLSVLEKIIETERMYLIYSTELWLLKDMTFAVVHYLGTLVKGNDNADCVTEYRSHVGNIENENDIFFEPEDLICELDDTCMFAEILGKAVIYEQ